MTLQRASLLALVALLAAGAGCVLEPAESPILDYLRADESSELVIELDAVDGLEPRDLAVEAWLAAVEDVVDKPAGVRLEPDEVLPGAAQWSFDDLREFEDNASRGEVGVVHLLWLDGVYAEEPDTLGLAWSNRHIAVFAETLERLCVDNGGDQLTGQGLIERACGETERAVLLHEIGHVFGLVNRGLPMVQDHEDPEHEGHDAEDSVMSWGYDGPALFAHIRGQVLDEEEPLGFGPASLADLAAVAGASERPEL